MRHADADNSYSAELTLQLRMALSLVDRAPFGICRASLSRDCFLFVNPAVCRMLGYSPEELLAVVVSRELYLDARSRVAFSRVLRRDRRIQAQEVQLRRKDGTMLRVRVTAFLAPDEHGVADHVDAYLEDLTEQSALEQQIRAVQKLEAVGQLAGGVAHDFNNILLVIKLSTDMMLGQITPDNPLTRSLLQVSQAADRAAALTKQMLAFSRRQVMQVRVVNINSVVRDTLHMLRRIIGEDIQLVPRLAEQLSNTTLDPDQLGQIVFNLAVNARDAMPQGGTLQIETANVELDENYALKHPPVPAGSYVMLTMCDTGEGISKSNLPRIFDPFFTTKELGKGTGLGLSIVYGIVKQSGGYIWVYSEPGLGTTFKLYFPVTHSTVREGPQRQEPAAQPNGETILMVEDDATIRANVRNCLQHLGYTVLEAANGAAAIEVCEKAQGKVDLLMTDLVMPGLGGQETADAIRRRVPSVRVVYTSGYAEESAIQHDLLEGGGVYLEKPYTVADLARTVQQGLKMAPGRVIERDLVKVGSPI